jgi:hypothetical protein
MSVIGFRNLRRHPKSQKMGNRTGLNRSWMNRIGRKGWTMKTTQHTYLHAMLIAVIAAAIFAVSGPIDDAAAQETKKGAQAAHSDKTGQQASAIVTRKASCRCGQLKLTYKGPDPQRITLCHCNSCQLRTGSVFSVQARLPRENVKISGKSTAWSFPGGSGKPVTYPSCDSGGATFHSCPVCSSTVYWYITAAPDVIGLAIGGLTDPTFPPPKISGFESYGHPWAMDAAALPIKRLKLAE